MSESSFVVHVIPSSSKAGPDGTRDGIPLLRVTSPPADGRANAEAAKLLRRLLKTRVQLVRGGSARRKTFSAELERAELAVRLRRAFGR